MKRGTKPIRLDSYEAVPQRTAYGGHVWAIHYCPNPHTRYLVGRQSTREAAWLWMEAMKAGTGP